MGLMSEMDIEVKNICPGKPERPIKGSEWTFNNLRGEWFEEAKLDGDRVILAHGTAFNRHEEIYQRDFSNKLGDIYDELRKVFSGIQVFDIEYMATGDNAGKCALLDIYTLSGMPYEDRHAVMRSRLPCHDGMKAELKYDIQVLPCLRVDKDKGSLYNSLKALNERADEFPCEYPFEGVVMKHPNHTYRFNRRKSDFGHWCKVRFK